MTKIKDTTVLITGGASGIGRLMGERCMQEGARQLILWDNNREKLEATTRELRIRGFMVHPYVVDVSDLGQVKETSAKVITETVGVDILINNAGIITGNKDFNHFSHAEIDYTMSINTTALMHVTLEFLPGMIQRGRGHIVNISSAAGMLSNPRMSVYCASKWAVFGWSEALRMELELNKTAVRVSTVNPSYINTGMFSGVKTNFLLPLLSPEAISSQIIMAIKRNRLFVRSPFMVRTLPFVKGVLPVRIFDLVVGKWLGVYSSMDGFKGHKNNNEIKNKD